MKQISKNPIFAKQKEQTVKTIENQLFGDHFKDKANYLKKIKMYKKLFRSLVNFPLISKKLQSKYFETSKLENLYKKIDDLESIENSVKKGGSS